jgi:hypothetical protein
MIESANYLDKEDFSDLQVCRSGDSYYIGTTYTDPETGNKEPGSRDTEYFPTKDSATRELNRIEDNTSTIKLRMEP